MNPTRITELRIENVKRIKAVHIIPDPDAHIVEITGRNGHGKTSVLDSIMYALGGKRQQPAKPVRTGAEKGTVVVDLGDMVAKRTFTPGGGSYLTVESKDGASYKSPQEILDKLYGELTFDPLEFSRKKPDVQAATLRAIAGLDFAVLDNQRDAAYAERTLVNRELKSAIAQADAIPDVQAPDTEVDIDALVEEQKAALTAIQQNTDVRAKLEQAQTNWESLEEEIEAAQIKLKELHERQQKVRDYIEAKKVEVAGLVDPDLRTINRQFATAQETNRLVIQRRDRLARLARVKEFKQRAEKHTQEIESAAAEKDRLLQQASFPVQGLGFDDTGITYNGVPFQQASSAEQLRISFAIGLALNPKLRIMLIRDGSLLDTESRTLLAKMAQAADAQVWLERATDGEPIGIVIEDGEVREHAEASA